MSKGGSSGNQTVTQQNIPDWAIGFGRQTLDIGDHYTMTPNYRPSTLNRDYSGIRGYNAQGQPNSRVGQSGLNPMPVQPMPEPGGGDGWGGGGEWGDGWGGSDPGSGGSGGPIAPSVFDGAGRPGTGLKFADGWSPTGQDGSSASPTRPDGSIDYSQYGRGLKFADQMPASGRGMGRSTGYNYSDGYGSGNYTYSDQGTDNYYESDSYDGSFTESESTGKNDGSTNSFNYWNNLVETITNPNNKPVDPSEYSESNPPEYYDDTIPKNDSTGTTTTTETTTVDPKDIFNADDLTPFPAYDRQRFAAPGANTLRGEGILAGRYDQRFGPGGTDPFAAANQAVGTAANYQSGFQGTMGEGGLGGQAGNYQQGLGSATDPNVFQSGNYTSGLPNFANPNANQTNVNSAVENVNSGLTSTAYSNANAGLTGPQNYNQNFQNLVNQSMNPYQDQVVNQTIADLNRARQMTQNQIGGQAAKAGAFGGSRQALLEAENNRNYLDRVAAATGQLRQQGFESAANRAQQENLQRLGLTASDTQNVRGLQSQGNLAAQGLTARDIQDVRGLQSQGALAAQGLQSQGGLAAQGLQSQGALAALGANAGLYQSALGLNAAGDRSAMGYNAGLLSDAMGLDAADLNQRRNLASNEAQFAETANRGAGALNLQGGQALGQLAQAGTADERQRIADVLAAGAGQDNRNQQDLDFIYNEFQRELGYPMDMINLRNAAISPATNSVVTTSSPLYGQNPLLQGLGAGLSTYSLLKD